MARLAGIELTDTWPADYALTKIKGIGWSRSEKVLKSVSLNPKTRVKDIKAAKLQEIATELDKYVIEGDLVRQIRENIHRLREISSYKGLRHQRGLPARGQRTKSNARTKRGKRRTVGSFRKDMLTKMQQSS